MKGKEERLFFLTPLILTFLPVALPNSEALFYFFSLLQLYFFSFASFSLAFKVTDDEYLQKAVVLGVKRLI